MKCLKKIESKRNYKEIFTYNKLIVLWPKIFYMIYINLYKFIVINN